MFRSPRRFAAFTIIELLIVIGIIGVLLAILLPTLERVRHQAYKADCAARLRQIGQAIVIYENDNHGNFPRTTYVPGAPLAASTGAASPDPFASAGPRPNDLTAAVYLLRRSQHLPNNLFGCPYNDVFRYDPDLSDPQTHSNFANWKRNLGYSIANPYPDAPVAQGGYQLTSHLNPDFPLAADINPGMTDPGDDVTGPTPGSSKHDLEKANSLNHERDGQNILYADGRVEWHTDPFAGLNHDNIYTNHANQINASPSDKLDAILLPTDD